MAAILQRPVAETPGGPVGLPDRNERDFKGLRAAVRRVQVVPVLGRPRLLHGRSGPCLRDSTRLFHRHPAPERDRRANHGPRSQQHHPGHPRPQGAHGRQGSLVAAGHRSCRYRHPERRREDPQEGRPNQAPRRPWPRGAGGQDLGMEGDLRRNYSQAVARARCLLRLDPHPLHYGPGVFPVRPEGVRGPLQEGPDLPRQAHGELVPGVPHGALRRGGRDEGTEGLHVPLPCGGGGASGHLLDHRHHSAGNNPRRHGRGREPQRSPLHAPRWQTRVPCAAAGCAEGAADHPHHRRRSRDLRLRHGRAEGHSGPRQSRLRDRPAPQSSGH